MVGTSNKSVPVAWPLVSCQVHSPPGHFQIEHHAVCQRMTPWLSWYARIGSDKKQTQTYCNVKPGLINHSFLTRGYFPKSHNLIVKWYSPQLNSRLGFMNPGLILHIGPECSWAWHFIFMALPMHPTKTLPLWMPTPKRKKASAMEWSHHVRWKWWHCRGFIETKSEPVPVLHGNPGSSTMYKCLQCVKDANTCVGIQRHTNIKRISWDHLGKLLSGKLI